MSNYGEKGVKRERRTDRPNERGGPATGWAPDDLGDAAANRANEHRCVAPKKPGTVGERFGCSCGTIFEWRNALTGWNPVYDPKEQLPHAHGGGGDAAGSEFDTYAEPVSLDDLFDGFDDPESF